MKIAIIGAGLSGLTAARMLANTASISLFEKARGVSGRMATRRAEPWFFDHGAQYFTARTEAFREFIQPMVDAGIVHRWNARYARIDGSTITEIKDWDSGEPRYVALPGMSALCKYLSQGLDIRLKTRITSIERSDQWLLHSEAGEQFAGFDWVLVTAPTPQAVDLLPENFQFHDAIAAIPMRACFSLMLGFEQPLALQFDAAHVNHTDISWIANNSNKPGRLGQFSLIVHSSEDFAEARIDDDREAVMQDLCASASEIIGHDVSSAVHRSLHGWRYANNANHQQQSPVFIDEGMQLAACGDWCEGGRVEGAFTSASRTIKALASLF